jgi:hypothetical protein
VRGEPKNTLYIPFPDIKDRVQPGPDEGAFHIIDANTNQYFHNFEWNHVPNGRGYYSAKWNTVPNGYSYSTLGAARSAALFMTPAVMVGHHNLIMSPHTNGYYCPIERFVHNDLAIAKHHLLTDDLIEVLPLFA